MTTNLIKIKGMTCKRCTDAVEQTVGELTGVDAVVAELETGEVTISQDGSVNESTIKELLEEIGFELA